MVEFDEPVIGGVRYDEYGLVIEDDDTTSVVVVQGVPIPGQAKQSEIEDWLVAHDGKFFPDEITTAHLYFAERYVTKFGDDSDNDFIASLPSAVAKYGHLTKGQAKGVLNVWRASIQYRRRQAAKAEEMFSSEPDNATGLDLTGLQGYYADPLHVDGNADTRLKLRINKSKNNGVIYVNDGAVYGDCALYGTQVPGKFYAGKVVDVLERIKAEPLKSMQAYGFLTGRCGNCHRPLEDELSVKRGFGPICWGNLMGD